MNSNTSLKIYLVDDDLFCLAMYKQHLLNMGFKSVSEFSTGQELMSKLHYKPDLIFLDCDLGESKGIDLLKKIKQYSPSIYVVMVSGQKDMAITIQALNSGAFDYIIKDEFETEKISQVIGKWLTAREYKDKLNSANNINPDENIMKIVLEAEEKVRREISDELHDNISQLLGASKLFIETACNSKKDRLNLLKESRGYITTALNEVRKLSHSLHTVYIKDIDLKEEIQKLANGLQMLENFKIITNFKINGISNNIPVETQHSIFRIIKEQLNNITKYSGATSVHLGLVFFNNELQLKISDNGIGFDSKKAKRGIGLTNMFNRIAELNGTYVIKTALGEGCSWDIKIPIKHPTA